MHLENIAQVAGPRCVIPEIVRSSVGHELNYFSPSQLGDFLDNPNKLNERL